MSFVVILLLAAQKVVKMTTCGVANDQKISSTTILSQDSVSSANPSLTSPDAEQQAEEREHLPGGG